MSLDIPNIDLQVTLPITIGNILFKGGQSLPTQNTHPSVGNLGGELSVQNYCPPAAMNNPSPPIAWSSSAEPIIQNASPPPVVNYSAAQTPVNIGDENYTMGGT